MTAQEVTHSADHLRMFVAGMVAVWNPVVSNAVARLDRDTAGTSTNTAAARQALEIKQRLVALAYDFEQAAEDQAEEAARQARREAREAARQAALQAAGGQ